MTTTTEPITMEAVVAEVLGTVAERRELEVQDVDELRGVLAVKERGLKAADAVLIAGRVPIPTTNGASANGKTSGGSYLSDRMLERGRKAVAKMPADGYTAIQLGKRMRCSEATARKVVDALLAGGELVLGEKRIPKGNSSPQLAQHYMAVGAGQGVASSSTSNGNSAAATSSSNGSPSGDDGGGEPDDGLAWLRELVQPVVEDRPKQVERLHELEAAVEAQKEKIKIGDRMGKAAGFPPPADASPNGSRRKKKKPRGVSEATLKRAWDGVSSLGGVEFTTRHAAEAASPPLDLTTTKVCLEIFKAEGRIRLVGERVPVDSERPAAHYEEVAR